MKHTDFISVKAPGGWGYSGNVENFEKTGNTALKIGGGVGLGFLAYKAGEWGLKLFFGNKEKDADHRRKMQEEELAHKRKMQEATHKSNLKKEEMNLEQEHWRERHAKQEASVESVSETETSVEDEGVDEDRVGGTWLGRFMGRCKMPNLLGILKTVIAICPPGYEPAMLLHLLSMFGALCFSKVRAKYLDGILHAPNLQVIIEGGWGTGKGKFETIHKLLFARIIEADAEKMKSIDELTDTHPVVQTVGLGLTRAKYFEVLYATEGLHLYNFSPEILAVINDLKKKNGLTFEHLRKAFDNSTVYQNNMRNKSKSGFFPVFYNYTFTGTPADTQKFISGELEGGTVSRIAFGVIPDTGKDIPSLGTMAEPELEKIRDQIDDWKSKYCYQTIDGEDIIQSETVIDLDYVNDALKEWLNFQFDLSKQEKNPARADARTRMATMAFHAGIPIAMMYGNPSAKEHAKRKAVIELTIYIATMCMERFLHKFGDMQNEQRSDAAQAEKAKSKVVETGLSESDGVFTEADVKEWIRLNKEERMGYQKIADEFKTTKDVVSGRIRRYIEKNSVK